MPEQDTYVMVCQGLAIDTVPFGVPIGQFLKSYDPEAHDGRGSARWTNNLNEALTFSSQVEAARLWRSIPRVRPKRSDGRPNRPLTAFTVLIGPRSDFEN
jgi:hypothetical protein